MSSTRTGPFVTHEATRIGSLTRRGFKVGARNPSAFVGMMILVAFALVVTFPSVIATQDPAELSRSSLVAPNSTYWFGTDTYGRDYFSRVVWGSRVSLLVAVGGMTIGTVSGTLIGVISAFRGGWVDLVVQRLSDTMLAIPTLVLALYAVAVVGQSPWQMTAVLAVAVTPGTNRIARSAALVVALEPYVEAARSVGAGEFRILARHVIPNILGSMLVLFAAGVGALIIVQAGLGFLGVGVQPPTPEWGQMLSESRFFAVRAPWLAIFPGAAISLAVLAVNLVGDGIRDIGDPRASRL